MAKFYTFFIRIFRCIYINYLSETSTTSVTITVYSGQGIAGTLIGITTATIVYNIFNTLISFTPFNVYLSSGQQYTFAISEFTQPALNYSTTTYTSGVAGVNSTP